MKNFWLHITLLNVAFLVAIGILAPDAYKPLSVTRVDELHVDGDQRSLGRLTIGPVDPPELYPFYLEYDGTRSVTWVSRTSGNNIIPTLTDERVNGSIFLEGSVDTSASTSGSVNAMGLQINTRIARSGGTDPLNAWGLQLDTVCTSCGGGSTVWSIWATRGGIRIDDPSLFGDITSDNITNTATIATSSLVAATGGGTFRFDEDGTIGRTVADTVGINSTITTFLTLRDATSTGTAVSLNAADTGGHKWNLGSSPTAGVLGAGYSVYDGTSGYEAFHVTNTTGGPGVIQVGNHLSTGTTFNGLTRPGVSACGTGSPDVNTTATDFAFTVTTGTGATGCVITFIQSFGTRPTCTRSCEDGTTPLYTATATAFTFGTGTPSNVKCDVICVGH